MAIQPIDGRPSDEALIARCRQQRDFTAFEELFRRHKTPFYQFLLRLSGSASIAEDVSQHCWLKLLESFDGKEIFQADRGARFRTFLCTIGRNRYLDEYVRRHEAARTRSLDVDDAALVSQSEEIPEQAFGRRQIVGHALSALSDLPEEQRDVVSLWANGYDADTIAVMTACPKNTVLSRKRYGIRKLRQLLTAAGVGKGR